MNVTKSVGSFTIPNWVLNLEKNYPTHIKKVNDVMLVHVNDIDFTNFENLARDKGINQNVKNLLVESFENDGFLEEEEPIIIFKNNEYNADTSKLSKPKGYFGRLCIHRLNAADEADETKFDKNLPSVVIQLQDGLSKQEVNFILAVIGLEENANRKAVNNAGMNDYVKGAYNMIVDYPGTPEVRMKYLEKELKKMKRNGSRLWTRYKKIREVMAKVRRLIDLDGVATKLSTFANGQEWVDRYYEDEFHYGDIQINNLVISSNSNSKFSKLDIAQPHLKSVVLYWPSNRIDRNANDIFLATEHMADQGEKTPIHIFLSTDTLDAGNLLHDRKTYARRMIELRKMFSKEVRELIHFVAFLPQHSSEEVHSLISFREFQREYLKDTLSDY